MFRYFPTAFFATGFDISEYITRKQFHIISHLRMLISLDNLHIEPVYACVYKYYALLYLHGFADRCDTYMTSSLLFLPW